MSEEAAQLRLQLDEVRHELQAAHTRISQLETQLSITANSNPLERYDHIFDHLLEACQIIGFDWRYLYLNQTAAREGRNERAAMLGRTVMELYPGFETTEVYTLLNRSLTERLPQEAEIRFDFPDGSYGWYEFHVQPIAEGIFVYSQEISPRKLAELNLRKLYRTLNVLSDVNQAIVRLRHDLPTLLQTVCKIAVMSGGFQTAWIGEIAPDKSRLIPIAWAGMPDDEFSKFDLSISAEEPHRRRPALQALFTGQRIVVSNTRTSEDLSAAAQAKEILLARGIGSLVFYPLKVNGTVRAIFSLSATETDYFDADELRLLDEMAGDLEYAMEFTEQEAQRQQAERSLHRYAQRLEVLHGIDHALLRADSIRTVISGTLAEIRKLIPCERAGVVLFDEPAHEAVLYFLDSETNSALQSEQRTPLPSPDWLADFSSRGSKNVGDLRAVSAPYGFYQVAVQEGMISILHILLTAQDKPLGLLNLLASTSHFFTPEYEEIAVEVGHQIAIAVRQMHLAQALERYTSELELRVVERTAELSTENERIQAILNYSLEGIAFLDANFEIVQTNAAFKTLIGQHTNAAESHSLLDLIHADDQARFKQTVARTVADSGGRRFEIRLLKPDRTAVNAEIGLQNITDDGFVCSFHDISDRQRAEQALRLALEAEKQTNLLKSRFVSMASHEFRTPLAAILASTETLTLYRERMKPEDISGRLENIRRQVNHMTGIIDDVLQLGRMQSGRIEFHPTLANLNALCSELVEEFNTRSETPARVVYTAPIIPIVIRMDTGLMRQSISNLIANALKYSLDPRPVQLHLSRDGEHVTLRISDEGIGIPDKDLPYLFEPFHRASNVGNISGTGLGLSITKQAIEQHGGTLAVESEISVGTTFTISLPITTI